MARPGDARRLAQNKQHAVCSLAVPALLYELLAVLERSLGLCVPAGIFHDEERPLACQARGKISLRIDVYTAIAYPRSCTAVLRVGY